MDDIEQNNTKKKKKKFERKKTKKDKIHKKMNNLEYLMESKKAKRISGIRGEIRMRIYKIVTA